MQVTRNKQPLVRYTIILVVTPRFILQSEKLTGVFFAIEEAVDSNKISIRNDKLIHADLGMHICTIVNSQIQW